MPEVKPDEALVQVRACGMCRSDVQLLDGYFRRYNDIPTPIIPGHEITGVVHKLGGGVAPAAGLQEGDHVVVDVGKNKDLILTKEVRAPKKEEKKTKAANE